MCEKAHSRGGKEMIFIPQDIDDVYEVELDRYEDERGFFARSWCMKEFMERGLDGNIVQCNIAYNKYKGTLRGMHYQNAPNQETKLVSCISGSVYDVVIDLRKESPTYCKWIGVILSAEKHNALYVPKGFAHGYQTLEDNSTLFYQVSTAYAPQDEAGVRYDDKKFSIKWPLPIRKISDKDKKWRFLK